jgi:catechol 2,3-dioxygenase-like lactoylglutathione lyase family enzyme
MPAALFRVIVPVSDIERAAAFYAAVMSTPGLRVSPGRHYFDCGGVILACYSPREDGDDHDPRPNPDHLYLAVDDLQSAFDACRTARAVFASGNLHGDPAGNIALRPWGERSFYVLDPFGNPLCFVDRRTVFSGPAPFPSA